MLGKIKTRVRDIIRLKCMQGKKAQQNISISFIVHHIRIYAKYVTISGPLIVTRLAMLHCITKGLNNIIIIIFV